MIKSFYQYEFWFNYSDASLAYNWKFFSHHPTLSQEIVFPKLNMKVEQDLLSQIKLTPVLYDFNIVMCPCGLWGCIPKVLGQRWVFCILGIWPDTSCVLFQQPVRPYHLHFTAYCEFFNHIFWSFLEKFVYVWKYPPPLPGIFFYSSFHRKGVAGSIFFLVTFWGRLLVTRGVRAKWCFQGRSGRLTNKFLQRFTDLKEQSDCANKTMDNEMLAKIQILQTYHNLHQCIDKILQKCIYDVTQAGKFDVLQDLCIHVIV